MPRSQKTGITPKPSAHRAFKPIRQIREPDVLRQFLFHSGFSQGEIRTTAFSGAIPPLTNRLGRRTGHLNKEAAVLYAIVAVPPFMAIAWMYREDYDRAGYLVLPPGKPRVPVVTLQTILPLLALVAISVVQFPTRSCAAILLALGFLYFGLKFMLERTRISARRLLAASIVYLPLLFRLSATLCSSAR
jgi:heme O synthase-like polyprenyltransferase